MAKADRESIAEELTYYHLLNDPDIVHAFYVTRAGGDAASEPLKLLQVSSEASTVGIVPIYFGASKEVPFEVLIVEIAEEEYPDLLAGTLKLPEGWDHRVEVIRNEA